MWRIVLNITLYSWVLGNNSPIVILRALIIEILTVNFDSYYNLLIEGRNLSGKVECSKMAV